MQIDQAVNPGLPFLFPWLNSMAKMFETYRIIKLVFFFKSTSADAVLSTVGPSGSTSLGSVIMMAQYNVLADPPNSKREMLNNATATSCKPSNSMSFTINPHSSYKTLFVRTPFTSMTGDAAGDRRLYDHCDFHLATEGMQASTGSIGELSVMAVMQFNKPTLVNEVYPFDNFTWTYPFTPVVGGNSLAAFRFNQSTILTTLKAVTGSTIKGYLGQNPDTGNWGYYFGDSADEQIGSIYRISFTGKLTWTGAATAGSFYLMSGPSLNAPANCLYSNCAPVGFLGSNGTAVQDILPNGLTSMVISPAPVVVPVPIGEDHGCAYSWYVQIRGRDAFFAPDQAIFANQVQMRWFNAAGSPAIPVGISNSFFWHNLTVVQVSPADY